MSGFNSEGVFGGNRQPPYNGQSNMTSMTTSTTFNQPQMNVIPPMGGTSMGPTWGTDMGSNWGGTTWGTNMGQNISGTTMYPDGSVVSFPEGNTGFNPCPQYPGGSISFPQGPYPPCNGGNGNGQFYPGGGTNMF